LEGNDFGLIDTRCWHFLRRNWRQRREIAGSPSTRSRCEPRTRNSSPECSHNYRHTRPFGLISV